MPISSLLRSELLKDILSLYPERKSELHHETDFQFFIAVILSAQTTDKQVNVVTTPMFTHIRNPDDLLKIPFEAFKKMVSRVNYFNNKAKHIYESAKILSEKYNGQIPQELEEIQKLPGVWIKTAKVILHHLYDAPFVGVDTHIHRVANRLGFCQTKTPEQTDGFLEKHLTLEEKLQVHHAIVLFGRYSCTARNPRCQTCILKERCTWFKKNGIKK